MRIKINSKAEVTVHTHRLLIRYIKEIVGQPTGESVEIIDFQKERKKKKEEKYTTQFIISSFLSPPQKKSKSRFHAVKIVTVCMRMYHHRCNCHSFSCKSRFRRSDTLERRFHDGSNVVLVARVLLLHPPSHAK